MRDHIIAEIKRVAAAFGNEPPGRAIFLRETGIGDSAWRGRYWARWGDALREAGFEPNKLQCKIGADLLFAKLAKAFRHYGKTPTSAELRIYRRTDPTFPGHTTLNNHFPTRAEMHAQFREWLVKNSKYDDVLAMLPAVPDVPKPSSLKKESRDGAVYLLRSGAYYKIGKSKDIERRIKEIRVALPETTILEHTIVTDDPSGIEAYWHKRFSKFRLNGEWFKLLSADVVAFKRRRFQ